MSVVPVKMTDFLQYGPAAFVSTYLLVRFGGRWSDREKPIARIALESLAVVGLYLAFDFGRSLAGFGPMVSTLSYLAQAAFVFLTFCLIALQERKKFTQSAKRREELEKGSWEYEAKRRVEEMKSAP
jgi:hypothetical protein